MRQRLGLYVGLVLALMLGGCELIAGPEEPVGNESTLPEVAAEEKERCYDGENVRQASRLAAPSLARDVLVLVDQTTEFPDDVRQATVDRVAALAAPGTRISVGTFSSYTEAAHSRIAFESVIEPAFPQRLRNDAPMRALRVLERCLADRRAEEAERLRTALHAVLEQSDPTMQRSDIVANVRDFSRRLNASPTDDRILLLVSDLLENSSTMSFYRNGAMRTIEPDAELVTVEEADLFSTLGNTRVYVIGAGLIPPNVRSYRSREEVTSLERFWTDYFQRSGAASVEIGTPRLHGPIT